MPERSSGMIAALVVVAVLATGTFAFMFTMYVVADEKRHVIAATEKKNGELDERKTDLQEAFRKLSKDVDDANKMLEDAKKEQQELKTWRDQALDKAVSEHKRIEPAVSELKNTITRLFREFDEVLNTMKESRQAFEGDERRLIEEIQIRSDELVRTVRQNEGNAKVLDTEIAQLEAKLKELEARLKIVQAEAMRGDTISDAGGAIMEVADPNTNFVIINLGSADRIRKGLKFRIWAVRRGYGVGWVHAPGHDFVKQGVMPGDMLVVGRGQDAVRYPIVSVGIAREAEERGLGLAGHPAIGTLKIIGPGITDTFSVAGVEWKVEHVTDVMSPDEVGATIKGMLEIVEVRSHSAGAVILPERRRTPVCPQCGWEAYKHDMRYCPFCFLGDDNNEVQPLDKTVAGILNIGQDAFNPVMVGDRLSNPYFAPNRSLVFVLGGEPVRETRQHMKAFIEYNDGKVVPPEELLVRPDEAGIEAAVRSVMPYEINYLIPGKGPDADKLLKRARELGIRIMREDELREFFGEID